MDSKNISKKFTRFKENFVCGNCGAQVRGTGYTNHCPVCLWSKHVDVYPGDRAHECGGMMEPRGVMQQKGVYFIVHRCQKCGIEKRNKSAADDNFDNLINIAKKVQP